MQIPFTKMQAAGNDYIMIDGFKHGELLQYAEDLARKMSDRHFGVGGDGVIFAMPSEKADGMMRIFNADGSEAEMCGNGIRQVAKFIYDNEYAKKEVLQIDTLAGVKEILVTPDANGQLAFARVDMGAPDLRGESVSARGEEKDGFSTVEVGSHGRNFRFTLVSMGNPHAVCFVKDVKHFDVAKFGAEIESNTEIFPKRTNVEFVEVLGSNEILMRVWERGSGETMACGTGATAAAVASVLNGFTEKNVTVHLLGGDLLIQWTNDTSYLEGDAQVAFTGVWSCKDELLI